MVGQKGKLRSLPACLDTFGGRSDPLRQTPAPSKSLVPNQFNFHFVALAPGHSQRLLTYLRCSSCSRLDLAHRCLRVVALLVAARLGPLLVGLPVLAAFLLPLPGSPVQGHRMVGQMLPQVRWLLAACQPLLQDTGAFIRQPPLSHSSRTSQECR